MKNVNYCGFDREDMEMICAACHTMSVIFAKSAENKDELMKGLSLARISLKIRMMLDACDEAEDVDDEKKETKCPKEAGN